MAYDDASQVGGLLAGQGANRRIPDYGSKPQIGLQGTAGRQQSEIDRELDQIDKQISFLGSAVENLQARLQTVSRPVEALGNKTSEQLPSCNTKMGDQLQQIAQRLQSIRYVLQAQTEALEL